jgi:hypothetical protein
MPPFWQGFLLCFGIFFVITMATCLLVYFNSDKYESRYHD